MSVTMIKWNGKMTPAEKIDGKWVPIEDAALSFDGKIVRSKEKESVEK